jgi:hypothetical protein
VSVGRESMKYLEVAVRDLERKYSLASDEVRAAGGASGGGGDDDHDHDCVSSCSSWSG